MASICSKCGATIADGHLFCSECGTPVAAAPAPEMPEAPLTTEAEESMGLTLNPDVEVPQEAPVMEAPAEEPSPVPEAVYEAPVPEAPLPPVNAEQTFKAEVPPVPQPVYTTASATAPSKEYKPVATAGFFFLALLFSIPGIGLIMSIILACAPKNINLKNYAKSVLIWKIIGLVLLIIIVAMCMFFANLVIDFFYDVVPIDGIGEFIEDIFSTFGL